LSAPSVGRVRKSVAEKDSRPLSLLGYVQGDAIRSDIVVLEVWAVDASRRFRLSHSTQQRARTGSSPAR
jgi:hypothetical protein